MLTQTVIPNELVNDGAYYACDFHLPVGSWANTQNTETAHAYAWHFLVSAWAPLWQHLSRGYFARGFWEEINAGNANTSNWLQGVVLISSTSSMRSTLSSRPAKASVLDTSKTVSLTLRRSGTPKGTWVTPKRGKWLNRYRFLDAQSNRIQVV